MIGLSIMAKDLAFRRHAADHNRPMNFSAQRIAEAFMYRSCPCGPCRHYHRIIDRISQGKKP